MSKKVTQKTSNSNMVTTNNAIGEGSRPLAMVTGASAGIGYELAACCARNGFDLVVAADEPEVTNVAKEFRESGVDVEAVEADLATFEGIEELYLAAKGRPVSARYTSSIPSKVARSASTASTS